MFSLLVTLCLPFFSCTSPPAASDITKLVVSHTRCEHCVASQFVFWPNGRFRAGGGYPVNDVNGTRPRDEFATMAKELVKLPAFGRRWDFATDLNAPITYFWIEAGKKVWQVRFPSALDPLDRPLATSEIGQLQNYDRTVSTMGLSDRYQALAPAIERARKLDTLQTVQFTSIGCYGRCPAFVATFHRDGSASLDQPRFVANIRRQHSIATVPFERVVAALRFADVASMPHEYGVHTVDTYGVSLHLSYQNGFTVDVDGPDSTSWDLQLAELVGALRQLVNDTDWR